MKSCFMFGHRICFVGILRKIEKSIERFYLEYGVRKFYVANRGMFDRLAVMAVNKLKEKHPDMLLVLVLSRDPEEYSADLPDGFDMSVYPPLELTPKRYAAIRASQFTVLAVDSIICYAKYPGRAKDLHWLAKLLEKEDFPIENLAER